MKRKTPAPSAAAPPGTKVTLGMVAAASGVSPSTVSRILNGTAAVSRSKRDAIDRAIAALGFVPDPIARGLAGGRTHSVGVITQTIDSPFYGVALRGIEEQLGMAGYIPLFVSGRWDAAEEARGVAVLCGRRVDGIILLSARLGDEALRQLARTMPVVVTGRQLRAPNLFSLDFDHVEGARLATAHLLALGHRAIALISGDPAHADSAGRLRGYRAALRQAGVRYDPALVQQGDYREDSGLAAAERLLDGGQPFSAILAANDQMAFGAALALYRRRMRVPDDISLVGIDDLPAAAHAIPPLTTVRQDAHELGSLAAAALLQLLTGNEPTVALSPPRLVARDTARAASDSAHHGSRN